MNEAKTATIANQNDMLDNFTINTQLEFPLMSAGGGKLDDLLGLPKSVMFGSTQDVSLMNRNKKLITMTDTDNISLPFGCMSDENDAPVTRKPILKQKQKPVKKVNRFEQFEIPQLIQTHIA